MSTLLAQARQLEQHHDWTTFEVTQRIVSGQLVDELEQVDIQRDGWWLILRVDDVTEPIVLVDDADFEFVAALTDHDRQDWQLLREANDLRGMIWIGERILSRWLRLPVWMRQFANQEPPPPFTTLKVDAYLQSLDLTLADRAHIGVKRDKAVFLTREGRSEQLVLGDLQGAFHVALEAVDADAVASILQAVLQLPREVRLADQIRRLGGREVAGFHYYYLDRYYDDHGHSDAFHGYTRIPGLDEEIRVIIPERRSRTLPLIQRVERLRGVVDRDSRPDLGEHRAAWDVASQAGDLEVMLTVVQNWLRETVANLPPLPCPVCHEDLGDEPTMAIGDYTYHERCTRACHDCDGRWAANRGGECTCGEWVCEDCARWCQRCDATLCAVCLEHCSDCDRNFCHHCYAEHTHDRHDRPRDYPIFAWEPQPMFEGAEDPQVAAFAAQSLAVIAKPPRGWHDVETLVQPRRVLVKATTDTIKIQDYADFALGEYTATISYAVDSRGRKIGEPLQILGLPHPHLNNGLPCWGNMGSNWLLAWEAEDLEVMLAVIYEFLASYNPRSAYVNMENIPEFAERWRALFVGRCCACDRTITSRDEYREVPNHGVICDACAIDCPSCGAATTRHHLHDCRHDGQTHRTCPACMLRCAACDQRSCTQHLGTCEECQGRFCQRCLSDGICRGCRNRPVAPPPPIRTTVSHVQLDWTYVGQQALPRLDRDSIQPLVASALAQLRGIGRQTAQPGHTMELVNTDVNPPIRLRAVAPEEVTVDQTVLAEVLATMGADLQTASANPRPLGRDFLGGREANRQFEAFEDLAYLLDETNQAS